MMIQITLTVPEAKRLIAKAIVRRIDVKKAMKSARVLLKGGTTISAVAEELIGIKLRIGGRVSPQGTMNALKRQDHPHCVLIDGDEITEIDKSITKVTGKLGADDLIIVSANAIDIHGNAAMMAAAPLGHYPGKALAGFSSQGSKVIVAVGLEKLIPGTIRDAILSSGRMRVDKSMGAAIGLIQLTGEIFTEKEAIESLADVKATVIGAGGIQGAEGSTTFVIEGDETEIDTVFDVVRDIKGASTSGTEESMEECEGGCPQCARHRACIYKPEHMKNLPK